MPDTCVLTKYGTGFIVSRLIPYANRFWIALDGHPNERYVFASDEFEVIS